MICEAFSVLAFYQPNSCFSISSELSSEDRSGSSASGFFLAFSSNSTTFRNAFSDCLSPLLWSSGCSLLSLDSIFTSRAMNSMSLSALMLSLIHICRCRRYAVCRSRWSPYH
eukprot:TRINITY_DN2493_c0_g1_i3.p1 TRINITY_DN2493_c0_g1~~TRINITY_DN2493_c0_g1_i3.p1  ORF type:complete len:112 (+),score=9.38 TRINITY_DN2493_c0_g1_i3:120-455(+)